jgi:hypothetical protein
MDPITDMLQAREGEEAIDRRRRASDARRRQAHDVSITRAGIPSLDEFLGIGGR